MRQQIETQPSNIRSFWEKVDKSAGATGCWKWLGGIRSGERGRWNDHDGKVYYAHKFAFFQARGRMYMRNARIRLTCGNTWCVNPRHMKIIGMLKGGTKLSLDNVRQIRYNYSRLKQGLKELSAETGVDINDTSLIIPIAKAYHVSRQTIYMIITGQNYKGL
jgi:hypothetical protein